MTTPSHAAFASRLSPPISRAISVFNRIPHSFIAFLGRFSIAAVFWLSGQTKIEGFALNIVEGRFEWGWPHLAPATIPLFTHEYNLPLISPVLAAYAATISEHLFPVLILLGLATRFSCLALLIMTLVIEIFVYPGAYATHGTWAAVLLYLMARGPGWLSIDHLLAHRWGVRPTAP